MHNMYMLTAITGKRSKDNLTRTRSTFEAKAATWRALWISASVAFAMSAVASAIIGLWAVFVFLGTALIVFVLLTKRSSQGLQQNLLFTALDKRKGSASAFYICGIKIDPDMMTIATACQATMPNPALVTPDATVSGPWDADNEGTTP